MWFLGCSYRVIKAPTITQKVSADFCGLPKNPSMLVLGYLQDEKAPRHCSDDPGPMRRSES